MLVSSKLAGAAIFVASINLLSACGTNTHEKSVSVPAPKIVPNSIVRRVSPSTSSVPKTTTTTTIDPRVQLLLREALFEQAYADAKAKEVAKQNEVKKQQSHYTQTTSNHSDAWWHGIAVCEQGGRNDPFFGYFSIMDGSAGGLDWSTQVDMANRIIDRAGDYAWAAKCVSAGYQASPNG